MATTGTHPIVTAYLPPRAKRGSGTRVDVELERVKKIARVMDTYMVDPIVGLILPGAGDIIGSMLGMYTVSMAFRRKVSPVIIARMLLNLALDALLGIVPLLGDLVDVGFKANQKNVALLSERSEGKARPKDWAFVVGAALLFFGTIALAIFGMISLVRWLA
jgi:hypothetical protein